jgi:hypothetical protein
LYHSIRGLSIRGGARTARRASPPSHGSDGRAIMRRGAPLALQRSGPPPSSDARRDSPKGALPGPAARPGFPNGGGKS